MILRKISAFFEYILIVLLIISTNTVFAVETNSSSIYRLAIVPVTLIIILLNFNFKFRLGELSAMALYLVVSASLLFYNTTVYPINAKLFIFNNIICVVLFWLFGSFLIERNRFNAFLRRCINVVVCLSVLSLFFWIFGSLLGFLSINSVKEVSWGDYIYNVSGYYNLYFETQWISLLGFNGWRNDSIFIEGPMFNIILSLAFLYQFYFADKKEKWKMVILIITIFSSFSTTGIVLVVMMLFYKIYTNKKHSQFNLALTLLSIPVIGGIGVRFLFDLIEDKSSTGSSSIRYDDIFAGFHAWMDNFFLGNGYGNIQAIIKHMDVTYRSNTGYSNGILEILSDGGIVFFLMLLLPVLIFLFRRGSSFNVRLLMVIWMVLLFATIIDKLPIFAFVCGLSYALLFNSNINRNSEYNLDSLKNV